MAANITRNVEAATRPPSRLAHLLRGLTFRTQGEQLVPRLYVRVPITAGQSVSLGAAVRAANQSGSLAGVRTIVVNVEGAPVRYCDADTAAPSYGELYPAGSSFSRTFRTWETATFAADVTNSGTAFVNVSLYSEPTD